MVKKKKKRNKKATRFTVPLLVGLLVVAAFAAGAKWTALRKGTSDQEEKKEKSALEFEVKQNSPAKESEPQQSEVLGEEQAEELEQGAAAVKGEDGAPVTIVEFSEYLCPFCAEYVGVNAILQRPIDKEKTYRKIMAQYVETGKVRYVFQDFPVHAQPAMDRAVAARCAGDQGKYWEYHDLLFEKMEETVDQEELKEKLVDWAGELGLDGEKFSACLASEEHLQAVKNSYELGQKTGVRGTPSFFVNGQKLVGAQPFENFKEIIEAELAK